MTSPHGRVLPSDVCSRIDPPVRAWNSSRVTSMPSPSNSLTAREYASTGHQLPMCSVNSSNARAGSIRTVTVPRIGSTAPSGLIP